ncbi:protein lin-28 homolog B isoform X2 [Oryctolagus cuniculus]|uniref:protein lin-28 homolog B isoform X2 n=1 Tax=Oryctolagus cuniculus TaxID=9986 RepID=UPI00387938D6
MRAKFVIAQNQDVRLMQKITPFQRESFHLTSLELRARGATWPKAGQAEVAEKNSGSCRSRQRRNPRFCTELATSKLFMEGFRSLKEGEPVEFTFKKSSKGLESIRVTGPGGSPCLGSERRPKGKTLQKRKPKGDRCYNCGGLDHHAKECSLPPQPKKCHCCQSILHMVANCPHKTAAQPPASSQGRQEAESQPCTSMFPREAGGGQGCTSPPFAQEARPEVLERPGRSPPEAASTKSSAAPEEPNKKGPSVQKRKKT